MTQHPNLSSEDRGALRAWADLDRFELVEVPDSREEGWAEIGELDVETDVSPWPPRPRRQPEKPTRVPITRISFGCLGVSELEALLDRVFSEDFRFVQTGLTRSGGTRPSGKLTCRGSFQVDEAGNLLAESFEYAPLIDFTRHVEHFRQSAPRLLNDAVSRALAAIDEREQLLRDRWEALFDAGLEGFDAVRRVVRAVRVRGERSRFATSWVVPGEQPPGQLPSFFRADLLRAARKPTPLVKDLVESRPGRRATSAMDVNDRVGLEPWLDPGRLPRASWPTGHRPRLSQQIAVTAIRSSDRDRLLSVNGPPGTGKTTLLRDVYAGTVTERAAVMAGFDDPRTGFGPEQTVTTTTGRRQRIHQPVTKLVGFEMLLASSNNAAVENVSKELPSADQFRAPGAGTLSYFRDAANPWPKGHDGSAVAGFRPGLLPEAPAWGMVAAALGSRDRVAAFMRVVGRYQPTGAEGTHLLNALRQRPSGAEWTAVRRRFREAQQAVDVEVERLSQLAADIREAAELRTAIPALQAREVVADRERATAEARSAATGRAVRALEEAVEAARLRVSWLQQRRPSWWARLRTTPEVIDWRHQRERAEDDAVTASADLHAARRAHDDASRSESTARQASAEARTGHARASRRCTELEARLAVATADGSAADDYVTEDWWRRRAEDRDASELGTAWVSDHLQRLREAQFAAAMEVHEVFLRSAGRQVADNLRTWMMLQTNEIYRPDAKRCTLAAWQSLFLVVPLVSTTFASVARLLKDLPDSALGHLVVDEAGQATPAAAVGAMLRCRQAVVVGDPQQLEPVVTLPTALVERLMAHHGAPAELAPTRASVQTLADAQARLGTTRESSWVGLPLVVHNRCLDPMFSVANAIGYGNAMVQGRLEPSEPIEAPMGASRWIDVPRADGGHFQVQDWEQVRSLLQLLELSRPTSVAVISPFKEVVRALSRRVEDEIRRLLPPDVSAEHAEKIGSSVRVGTIHTFQGQERSSVVLVLGGGKPGAREWAARTPNLINVAVTRAKDRLYVVGDFDAWSGVGHAAELAARLPRVGAHGARIRDDGGLDPTPPG